MSTGGSRATQVSVLAVIAAGLTIAAMFVPYLRQDLGSSFGDEVTSLAYGLWDIEVTPDPPIDFPVPTPLFGILFAVIAFALLIAALLARPRPSSARYVLVGAASASLAGALMLLLSVLPQVTIPWPGQQPAAQLGLAMWLLGAASVVAVVAAGFALVLGGSAHPTASSGPPTEPIPVVQDAVIHQLPAEADR